MLSIREDKLTAKGSEIHALPVSQHWEPSLAASPGAGKSHPFPLDTAYDAPHNFSCIRKLFLQLRA